MKNILLMMLAFSLNAAKQKPKTKNTNLSRKAPERIMIAKIFGKEIYEDELEKEIKEALKEKYITLTPEQKKQLFQQSIISKMIKAVIANDENASVIKQMKEYKKDLEEIQARLIEKYYLSYLKQNISTAEINDAYETYVKDNAKRYKIGAIIVDSAQKGEDVIMALKNGNASVENFQKLHDASSIQEYKQFVDKRGKGVFESVNCFDLKHIFGSDLVASAVASSNKKGVLERVLKFGVDRFIVLQIFDVKKEQMPASFEKAPKEVQNDILDKLANEQLDSSVLEARTNGSITVNSQYFSSNS